ncbi:Glutaminase kidney isoform, mitochondrial [Fragariocoptes setiger]|uniref:glutaminase n=1 Tax=Fragariocoptes setiger TaxID=1670756 RepID=A0ABQ7SCI4_9ACAR|nr:Glutaminase kidney isoform, mitochondrial [Fragariocoptes setiger]
MARAVLCKHSKRHIEARLVNRYIHANTNTRISLHSDNHCISVTTNARHTRFRPTSYQKQQHQHLLTKPLAQKGYKSCDSLDLNLTPSYLIQIRSIHAVLRRNYIESKHQIGISSSFTSHVALKRSQLRRNTQDTASSANTQAPPTKAFRESLFVHSDELKAKVAGSPADNKADTANDHRANEATGNPGGEASGPQRPRDKPGEHSKAEDLIFEMFQDGNGLIRVSDFLGSLTNTGLTPETDIRLNEFMANLKALSSELTGRSNNVSSLFLDKAQFKHAIQPNIVLISKAMRGDFVIPDWTRFSSTLEEFYWHCRVNKGGQVANYIPQLSKFNPDYFGVSVCSIDGQRYNVGDKLVPFTIQSSGKPINYAIALNELGTDVTHQYVGQEPSGRLFNDLSLKIFDEGGRPRPHNPMVNSGAIVVCSLLMNLIKPEMRSSEKFDWVCDFYKSMAGGEYIGFNNATFLSEREAADRNYAIAFYMRENKCFPENANLQQVMDFYFQLCSLEVNTQTLAMIAATLANGGICPITEKKVIDSLAVRNVLSLMHSCGMYDYSGQFAFYVGLPAKSGVSGCTLVVVPNVAGFGLFSPPLDCYGNSVRGLQFCHELINKFNFHQYDNLRHVPHKSDPRRRKYETSAVNIISLLFAAAKGDMSALRRLYMSGMDMGSCDYDHRTALHTAAAEGHLDIIEFLLHVADINHEPRDRWGRRPIDDAMFGEHKHVILLALIATFAAVATAQYYYGAAYPSAYSTYGYGAAYPAAYSGYSYGYPAYGYYKK